MAIKMHPFFGSINWPHLEAGILKPPFEIDVRLLACLFHFILLLLKHEMHDKLKLGSQYAMLHLSRTESVTCQRSVTVAPLM